MKKINLPQHKETNITFMKLFFTVLFVLKVTNLIDCSWWWITAPLWLDPIIEGIFRGFVKLYNERVDDRN